MKQSLRLDNTIFVVFKFVVSHCSIFLLSLVAQDLEKALAQRESAMRELEASLREQREVINHQHDELRLMNERLGVEARRVKSLEREGDRLRSEISLLESKVMYSAC